MSDDATTDQWSADEITREILLREFSESEMRLLIWIVRFSFRLGQVRTHPMLQQEFCGLTGWDKSQVSRTLNRLDRCHVIEEEPPNCYAVRLPVEGWLVPRLVEETAELRALEADLSRDRGRKGQPELPQGPGSPDDLRRALYENLPMRRPGTSPAASCPGALPAGLISRQGEGNIRESAGVSAEMGDVPGSLRGPGQPTRVDDSSTSRVDDSSTSRVDDSSTRANGPPNCARDRGLRKVGESSTESPPVPPINALMPQCCTALKHLNSEALMLTWDEECALMDRLRDFVGKLEWKYWVKDWRANWVRGPVVAQLLDALATLEKAKQEGWQPRKAYGAALKDLALRRCHEQFTPEQKRTLEAWRPWILWLERHPKEAREGRAATADTVQKTSTAPASKPLEKTNMAADAPAPYPGHPDWEEWAKKELGGVPRL